mgnify:CR=1 FL=1
MMKNYKGLTMPLRRRRKGTARMVLQVGLDRQTFYDPSRRSSVPGMIHLLSGLMGNHWTQVARSWHRLGVRL